MNNSERKLVKEIGNAAGNLATLNRLLWMAAGRGYVHPVEAAIAAGADLESTERDQTPLGAAARNGHLKVVRLLLKAGAGNRSVLLRGWIRRA